MARVLSGPTVGPDTGDLLLVSTGDTDAAQRILERWRTPVFALLERSLPAGDAAEASVSVFVALFRSAGDYDPATSFAQRLYRLLSKEIERRPATPLPPIPAQRLKESAAARAALLRSAVAALPPHERSAFLFTRVARLPLPLASAATGASEAELRRRLVRAFTFLSSSLAPLLPSAAPLEPADAEPSPAP